MTEDTNLLEDVHKQFLSMVNTREIHWKEIIAEAECTTWQKKLLEMTIHSPTAIQYPPSHKYTVAFLKKLITELEKAGFEVTDELYEAFTPLLTAGEQTKQETRCYKSYKLPTGDLISLQESTALISHGTTGLQTWIAGLCLAEWAFKNIGRLQGRNIVELGSGLGVTGLSVCLVCQPAVYVFTDSHKHVMEALIKNIDLNIGQRQQNATTPPNCLPAHLKMDQNEGTIISSENNKQGDSYVGQSTCHEKSVNNSENRTDCYPISWSLPATDLHIKELEWETVDAETVKELEAEIILAADVTYDPSIIPPLVRVLKLLLWKPNMVAYIASTVRNEETMQIFIDELDKNGLNYEEEAGADKQVFYKAYSCPTVIHRIFKHQTPPS